LNQVEEKTSLTKRYVRDGKSRIIGSIRHVRTLNVVYGGRTIAEMLSILKRIQIAVWRLTESLQRADIYLMGI
jgi:hypothetical protein